MATRPIFIPCTTSPFVDTRDVDFHFHPGFSIQQKQRSIQSLHEAAREQGVERPLEISSKSPVRLGVQLSAFNLHIITEELGSMPVEVAFQGSKVFEHGGPYVDLYRQTPRDAKRDPRLRDSGELTSFEWEGRTWALQPTTAFYDWLYLTALHQNSEQYAEEVATILEYDGFTDIEFNPRKSLNCQARSAALYVGLHSAGLLYEALQSPETFVHVAFGPESTGPAYAQGSLFE